MLIKRLLSICAISILITGCANMSGTQPPAPVYGGQSGTPHKSEQHVVKQKPHIDESKSSTQVKIQPLKDIATPDVIQIETFPAPLSEPSLPEVAVPFPADVPTIEKTENLPIATESKSFEPLDSVASGSAAVSALVLAANQDSQTGKMDSAVATMERAIRLEPRNPTLLYKLAVLRLQQSKPAQAEDLAKKAALLASKDIQLKKHSWLLIARAREMQHDSSGAQEARQKADSF
jgi:hypothetical protein